MKLKPFAFIVINMLFILIHFIIICIIIKMHCKRLLQMQDLHGAFTECTRRSKSPTACCLTRCANAMQRRLF